VVDQPPLVVALLAIAVVPAVCEELLFRGAVQRAFTTRLFPIAAIVLTALLFAGYHMSLIQLMPTFTLGLLLGVLAHRADSVVPAMLAHFLNNTMAILVARRQPAVLADTIAAHPTAALVGCAIASVLGVSLILKGPA
jgi:membrane protease YdiL (CAAX protease family)